MSRTVKHPGACKRAKCALCHPWKHGWVEYWWEKKMRFSDYRRYVSGSAMDDEN